MPNPPTSTQLWGVLLAAVRVCLFVADADGVLTCRGWPFHEHVQTVDDAGFDICSGQQCSDHDRVITTAPSGVPSTVTGVVERIDVQQVMEVGPQGTHQQSGHRPSDVLRDRERFLERERVCHGRECFRLPSDGQPEGILDQTACPG
jgi:hypothetical protein